MEYSGNPKEYEGAESVRRGASWESMDEADISVGAKRQGPSQQEVIYCFGWDAIYI